MNWSNSQAGRMAFSRACALEAAGRCTTGASLRPTEKQRAWFHDLVTVCRIGNGGGGACHVVSEVLENEFGWARVSGSYLDRDGRVLCADGHYWNVLPDGAWLDATADQFGEATDIVIVPPGDPEHARYRYAFEPNWHPADPHPESFRRRFQEFSVEDWPMLDEQDFDDACASLGRHWHLRGDRRLLDDYFLKDAVHKAIDGSDPKRNWAIDYQMEEFRGRLQDSLSIPASKVDLIGWTADHLDRACTAYREICAIRWGKPGNRIGDPSLTRLRGLVDQTASMLAALDQALRDETSGDREPAFDRIAHFPALHGALGSFVSKHEPYPTVACAAAPGL